MSAEEDKSLKGQKSRTKREQRRSTERKERKAHPLADSSTPLNSKSIQKTSNPADNIQDSNLPAVQEENIVTAPTASTVQQDNVR